MKRQDNQWKVRGVLYGHLGLWEFISSELRASENVKVSDRHRSRWAAHHRPPLDSFYVFVLERIKSARRARRCLSSGRTRNRSSLSQGPPFNFFLCVETREKDRIIGPNLPAEEFFFKEIFCFVKLLTWLNWSWCELAAGEWMGWRSN